MTAKVLYVHPSQVRISDINYGQHLGHDTLVSLLHDARCAWLAAHGLSELALDGANTGWVVANLNVSYLAESFYGDALSTQISLARLGTKSLTLQQEVLRPKDACVLAKAEVTLVCFNFHSRAASQVPQALLRLLD